MTGFLPKEKLTAYQRWEVAAFDEAEQAAARAAKAAESTPETTPDAPDAPDAESVSALALPTAADIERIHQEAHQQGFDAGFSEGQAAAQALADQMSALLTHLPAALKDVDQQIAEQLLATATEIAHQVVRQTLQIKPEMILPVVREAVASLNVLNGHPALFLHPDDARLVRQKIGEQLTHNNWRIIEDAGLTRGGCRVEMGASEVDATVETRWRRVIEAMGISTEWLAGQAEKP